MFQYTVNWKLTDIHVTGTSSRRYTSELKLSIEWTVLCLWKIQDESELTPHTIEIRRNTCNEEILIFGTLNLSSSGEAESEQQFSEIMKSGSSVIAVHLEHSTSGSDYTLLGVINITSNSEKCASYFGTGENKKCIQLKSLVRLSDDFELLLEPQVPWLADVNLKCGDVSIPAHKIILSVRSPVFAAMFKNPMMENIQNQVDISDMDASVLRTLLVYMYTGKTSDLTVALASDLLHAADKYQLCDLKSVCSDFLMNNISSQNVLKVLVLGDLFAEDLKSFAKDYICNSLPQFSALENTEEWITLRKNTPCLAMEVLTSLVKSRENLSLVKSRENLSLVKSLENLSLNKITCSNNLPRRRPHPLE